MLAFGSAHESIQDHQLDAYLDEIADQWVIAPAIKRLLLVPPDHTRLHSRAGHIAARLWKQLSPHCSVDIMPALGTHKAMTAAQCEMLFGSEVPFSSVKVHRWREELTLLGEISSEETHSASQGRFDRPIQVEVNRRIVSGDYDLILSIGQVVPHEVIGFANYTKNICIGTGGPDTIHKTHFLGAVCDMETMMGRVDTPVREIVDLAYERHVRPRSNVKFLLTVVEETDVGATLRGLFCGADRDCYEAAAEMSSQVNITHLDQSLSRCVVYLDPREFHSTWLGNKAIYRTRMAMADGGELVILAPAVQQFGEDATIDQLVRRHGYHGTSATLQALKQDAELESNLSAAAHLIHGSSEGRFQITYCTPSELDRQAIESVGFAHRPYADAAHEFDINALHEGWNATADGKRFYFIRNPALGLWMTGDHTP